MKTNINTKIELLKTGKDFLFYMPTKVVPALLSFISIPVFTHKLGPANYGILALITIFVSLSITIISNWLISSIIRFLPLYQNIKKEQIFVNTINYAILIFSLFIVLLILIGLFIFKARFDNQLFKYLLIACVQIFFIGVFNIYIAFFRANRKAKIFTTYSVINAIASVVLSIIFVLMGFNILGILIGNAIPPAILTLIVLWHLNKNFKLDWKKFSLPIAKESISYGFPLVLSGVSIWALSSSDRYILKYFLDDAQVGIYSASSNIVKGSLLIIISSFILASTPSLVNFWEHNKKNAVDFLAHLNRSFILIIFPLTILIGLLAQPIMILLTPASFLEGYKIMFMVSIGVFFWGLYQLAYTGLYLAKKTWIIALNILIMGAFNILTNFILIPRIGIMGSAVAILVSYILIFLSSVYLVRNILPIRLPQNFSLAKYLIAIILPAIPSYLFTIKIELHAIFKIIFITIIYLGLYLALLYLLNLIYPGELKIIQEKYDSIKKRFI